MQQLYFLVQSQTSWWWTFTYSYMFVTWCVSVVSMRCILLRRIMMQKSTVYSSCLTLKSFVKETQQATEEVVLVLNFNFNFHDHHNRPEVLCLPFKPLITHRPFSSSWLISRFVISNLNSLYLTTTSIYLSTFAIFFSLLYFI